MASLRIFVADGHEIVRSVIVALLVSHPGWELCGEAADGPEALEKVATLKPDIVLLDINIPNMNGLEATRRIVREQPSQNVIILSVTDADQEVIGMFDAGARGFILTANATYDLVSAVEALQEGRTFFTTHFAELILKNYLKGTQKNSAELTERERETVHRLAKEVAFSLARPSDKRHVAHPAGKYSTIAVIVVIASAIGWFTFPDQKLPGMDKLFVRLRLKKLPTPVYDGNPDTKVWIDLRTALYYCPGADFYGKTRKGKFARQRDAQQDHFEPASRKACN